MTTQTARPVSAALAAGTDALAVLVFAVVGRGTHAEAADVLAVLGTAAPFLLGLLVAWLAVRAWRAPLRPAVGAGIWVGVVSVGLGVRAAFTHRLPITFVLVAAVSLGVLLLGWRALAGLIARHRPSW